MNLKRFFQGEKMTWPPLAYQEEAETKCPVGRSLLAPCSLTPSPVFLPLPYDTSQVGKC